MEFILAKGFSIQNVNEYACKEQPNRHVNASDLFDKCSLRTDSSILKSAVNSESGLEEGELVGSPISAKVTTTDTKAAEPGVVGVVAGLQAMLSWSSVVAKGEPLALLKLDFLLPAPPLRLKMGLFWLGLRRKFW